MRDLEEARDRVSYWKVLLQACSRVRQFVCIIKVCKSITSRKITFDDSLTLS